MSKWTFTSFPGLVRYTATGMYYARVKRAGRLIERSLKTDVHGIARRRLADLLRTDLSSDVRPRKASRISSDWALAKELYLERLRSSGKVTESTIRFRQWCLKSIEKTWPEVLDPDKQPRFTKDEVRAWWERVGQGTFGAQYGNNLLGTLRGVLNRPDFDDPTRGIRRRRVSPKRLVLPSQADFQRLVGHLDSEYGPEYGRLARLLAYTGLRIAEMARLTWDDVDLAKGLLRVAPGKNHQHRFVPIIDDARVLLTSPESPCVGTPVMQLPGGRPLCMRSQLGTACRALGIARVSHHDLRHLFATRCIESGVDIPTVSRWLGHQDGGALALKTYGHLRDEHSSAMAAKVKFTS